MTTLREQLNDMRYTIEKMRGKPGYTHDYCEGFNDCLDKLDDWLGDL